MPTPTTNAFANATHVPINIINTTFAGGTYLLYNAGNKPAALNALQQAARLGNPKAQSLLRRFTTP